jgi:hypothetical protein
VQPGGDHRRHQDFEEHHPVAVQRRRHHDRREHQQDREHHHDQTDAGPVAPDQGRAERFPGGQRRTARPADHLLQRGEDARPEHVDQEVERQREVGLRLVERVPGQRDEHISGDAEQEQPGRHLDGLPDGWTQPDRGHRPIPRPLTAPRHTR